MVSGTRLLPIAEALFGSDVSQRVFEPLIADYQYEARLAAHGSVRQQLRVHASGLAAFGIASASSAVSALASPPPLKGAALAIAGFIAATLTGWPTLLGVALIRTGMRPPLLWRPGAFLVAIAAAVPLALLPTALLMRRDARATHWHACQAVVLGIVVYAASLSLGSFSYVVPPTAAALEREYQQALANDRAGLYEYPASAVRSLRSTTFEEREAQRRRTAPLRELMFLRVRGQIVRSFWSARTAQPLMLIVLLAMIGWQLGSRQRAGLARAIGWWFLASAFYQTLATLLPAQLRNASLRQVAYWAPTALFTAVVIALLLDSRWKDHEIDQTIARS